MRSFEQIYRKTMRSVKYAALCILLTFASFFLIDTGCFHYDHWAYSLVCKRAPGFCKAYPHSFRYSLLMYTYLFTILQLQDYSLLLGSFGLFLTLAVLMHFSKKFKW